MPWSLLFFELTGDESGQSKWATDLDTARQFAQASIDRVATEQAWPAELKTWADGQVSTWYENADGWFVDDVPGFWDALADAFEARVATGGQVESLAKVAAFLRSAQRTADGAEAADEANDPATILLGTAEGSADDALTAANEVAGAIRDTAKGARKVAKGMSDGTKLAWGLGGLTALLGLGLAFGLKSRVGGR